MTQFVLGEEYRENVGPSSGLRMASPLLNPPSNNTRKILDCHGLPSCPFPIFPDIMHASYIARMRAHGAELIGEMLDDDTYRLAYIFGV